METYELEYLLEKRVRDHVDGHWGDRVEVGDVMVDEDRRHEGGRKVVMHVTARSLETGCLMTRPIDAEGYDADEMWAGLAPGVDTLCRKLVSMKR